MIEDYEWDLAKARSNERKHGVSFAEAVTVFGDDRHMTRSDVGHSTEEDRFVTIGLATSGRVLVVIHADRGRSTRIISARLATRAERKIYEEE